MTCCFTGHRDLPAEGSPAYDALLAALTVYFLTPLFCPAVAVPTLATRAEMLQNGFDLLAVSLSSALGLLLVFVFTFGLSKGKRTP